MISKQDREIGILIDPDKVDHLDTILNYLTQTSINYILVGGSIITNGNLDETILKIKSKFKGSILLFPGDHTQISEHADGLLFLSLISGRNPDLLIGKHVLAAPKLKQSKLTIYPCGYILVNSGNPTSVEYMSHTQPIPSGKPEIAAITAYAGELLGMKYMYMESGSGAKEVISTKMISMVSNYISIPLIIGGGISNVEQIKSAHHAGANLVIVGTEVEKNPEFILKLKDY